MAWTNMPELLPGEKSSPVMIWYGMDVETERHYKGDDPEVEAGRAKTGDRKPGLQLHVHIIVSPHGQDTDRIPFPLSKSRGNRQILDGKEVIVGFDRSLMVHVVYHALTGSTIIFLITTHRMKA